MEKQMRTISACMLAIATASVLGMATARPETGAGLATPGGERLAIVHAEGAQIYECVSNTQAEHVWQFREPIATLLQSGNTVGRHYAGPSWEFADGTAITAKPITQAPAATVSDIPHLMLTVTGSKGRGPLSVTRTVIRINTKGGLAKGVCSKPGELMSVPYSADYAFFDGVRDN